MSLHSNHIRKVYACLTVTCHLHFWQNDRDLLRAATNWVCQGMLRGKLGEAPGVIRPQWLHWWWEGGGAAGAGGGGGGGGGDTCRLDQRLCEQ